jgi:rubrerythrin
VEENMGVQFDFSMLDAMDILDLAVYVEKEAQESYEELASWAGDDNPEARDFFTRMAGFEARHGAQIAARREELFGGKQARYTDTAPWDVETPDIAKLGDEMSLQRAYELALDAENRAADYYRSVIDYVSEPLAVELLEALRDSEVEHQRLIREEMARL